MKSIEVDLNDPYLVIFEGEPRYFLNKKLAKDQGLEIEDVKELVSLHMHKLGIFKLMKETDDKEKLRDLAKQVEETEFKLQAGWGFPLDKTYHEWYLVPKCTCPIMDNAERKGTKYQISMLDCPIHGE